MQKKVAIVFRDSNRVIWIINMNIIEQETLYSKKKDKVFLPCLFLLKGDNKQMSVSNIRCIISEFKVIAKKKNYIHHDYSPCVFSFCYISFCR